MLVSDDFLKKDYIRRINLVLNFIDDNFDSELLSLEELSKKALYSPYHFHRIFKAVIGETLNTYVIRRRLEKAASILIHRKDASITDVYVTCGFKSNAVFTRSFKKHYKISPSEFRKENPSKFSKINQVQSKKGQQNLIFEKYICNINNHLNWIKMNAKIEIKHTPKIHFASLTHIGVNGIENAFDRLIKWATPKGLMLTSEAKMARVFHDSFKVTPPDKVRMSISLLTNSDFKNDGEIHKTTITEGRYIVGRFEIQPIDFEQAWTSLYVWMNDKGYKKAEGNPFEIYQNDFREHPENKFIVDLHIPIE